MRRVIIDYKKLTPEVLNLLTSKYPDGYGDDDIIMFDNHRNERIEAVEVKTDGTIYLVKVGSKLQYTMTNFDSSSVAASANIDHEALNSNPEKDD